MNKKIELLAPGGDVDAAKAAILAGANAIYCGLDRFNARNSAANISFENLQGILRLAHKNNCEVFLTLNIIIVESEIPALITLLNKLVNTTIDGIIIQDLGMFYLLKSYFKSFKIHASTQLTTHNEGQLKFLNRLNVNRINLSRELNIDEIKALTSIAHQNNILTEVFVHGSNCISFSGLCYMSSLNGGNSGNRGRCSQPCRDQYIKTEVAKDFPLNLKDNSAFFDLKELADAGVDSLKIEGRIKKFDYVFTVVNAWRKQLDSFYNYNSLINNNSDLYKVFNRDFSNTFLKGDIHKDMFIDNPRDHSIKHLSEINNFVTVDELEKAHLELYAEKDKIKNFVENAINQISIDKRPLIIIISGEYGIPLKLTIKMPEKTFVIFSESNLENQGTEALSKEMLLKRLKAINNTEFYIEHLELDNFQTNLYLPFNELTAIKKKILFLLNGSREIIAPVEVPKLIKQENDFIETELTILISSVRDVFLGDENDVKIYFQLPESFKDEVDEYVSFFEKNKKLIPWFPSVLIGDDYNAAVNFLLKLNPKVIVTNNTGIAYEAYINGISWIAGPYLNIVNSYSLLCLKENFNCSGAFISNEINKAHIQRIIKPDGFELHYSIFHPIMLMTSRQCLFHQVTGCEKNSVDDSCIKSCEKSATIKNLKNQSFLIDKKMGNHHCIYNDYHFLNADIHIDIPDLFSGFMIDLRDVKTKTSFEADKSGIIKLFKNLITGESDAKEKIYKMIHHTVNEQYIKGI